MSQFDPDDSTRNPSSWWKTLGGEGPKPYASASWTYSQVVVEEEDSCDPSIAEDQDDLTCEEELLWWETIGGEGPKPYTAAAWTYTQTVVEEEEDEADRFDPILNLATGPIEWWETIGGEGPKPYATAAWTYIQEVQIVEEFVPVSLKLFFVYDEEFYPRTKGLGVILDSGYFGQKGEAVYDSAYYLGGERGILMKRKLAKVLVYDQLSDSPGFLPAIAQPLGNLATDPNFGDTLVATPGDEEIGAELNGAYWASVNTDTGPQVSLEISCDGDLDGVFIEAARASIPQDDVPPGTLLGSVSYELFGDTVTITDWEHLNWQDDTPVLKAVKVILNELPSCVTEVKVLDPPHAFWTSLGFRPNFKGDEYLHLYTV
jgi:hypothetical protein